MAAGQVESEFSALCFDHTTRIRDVSECKCCINMKKELKELQDELSSANLIIKLLQSENHPTERASYRTIEPRNLIQCTYMNVNTVEEGKWIEVTPGHRKGIKQITTSKEFGVRQVETENRYCMLQNLQETNAIAEGLELKKNRGIANANTRIQKKKKHKAILIGDSHARGCAEKLSSYLGNDYEVTGYVSPNTGLEVITNSAKEEIEQLTQNDIVIVCGGTNNISKNESKTGLRHVTHFVQNKRNTNVIIMGAPHRYDLEESSCVNKEVKVFNRKLNKIMKRYNHIKTINMSAKREHYTQHGLHMNKTGKEWITRKTADIINKLFANLKPAHIPLEWKGINQEDPVKNNVETVKEFTTQEMNTSTLAATGLIQEETGNKPKQSTEMRKKCGIQKKENEVNGRNTSHRNKDIKLPQNNADKNSEERLNQIEDEATSDNDVKNNEDSVSLQSQYTTSIDIAVYPSPESKNGKTREEPPSMVFPSYPRRNCPTKKNPDFLWA